MPKWSSAEIRASFLSFFEERGHTIVPSAPLIPIDDPTLLFTNAGMNQFKDVFLGLSKREYTRVADTQKCMRVSGKHNDLEEVGRDGHHHTFFEMLGNWSFGDYYKKEAIRWAWELLTGVWGLPKDRLYATVLEDDAGDLGLDHEAVEAWRTETDIDASHILPFGRSENFWEMAETGPCGPCSEINIDRGPTYCDRQDIPGHVCRVNGDCGRYIEFWNLVFIQYNHLANGSFEPLPQAHVDTGMGLERMVAIVQNADSNYDTDLFVPIMDRTQVLLGHSDEERAQHEVAYRVIADHGRAVTFLVGDGVMPGNEGREYVLRMILRRAARFGRKIGFTEPFMGEIAKVVIRIMGDHFGELVTRQDFILNTIVQEEERFLRTLDRGLERMHDILRATERRGEHVIAGRDAFTLWTQDGFPFDLIRDIAEENGLGVDRAGYEEAMAQHRLISGKGAVGEIDVDTLSAYSGLLNGLRADDRLPKQGVAHLYEEYVGLESRIVALLRRGEESAGAEPVKHARPGDKVEVVLAETPFYVESGGQVSDIGVITAYTEEDAEDAEPEWVIEVEGVREPVDGLLVHVGTVSVGMPRVNDRVWAVVDEERRMDIARNHTATHLLHGELRYVLGTVASNSVVIVSVTDRDRPGCIFTFPTINTFCQGAASFEIADNDLTTVMRLLTDTDIIPGLKGFYREQQPNGSQNDAGGGTATVVSVFFGEDGRWCIWPSPAVANNENFTLVEFEGDAFVSLDCSQLTGMPIARFTITNTPNLPTATLPTFNAACLYLDLTGIALTSAMVDALFVAFAAFGTSGGTMVLNGADHGDVTTASLTARTSLIADSWTLSFNT